MTPERDPFGRDTRHEPPAITPARGSGKYAGMAVVYLLAGPTGSGKTTYATRVLAPAGAVRLSVDERIYARHGRYGVDYPEDTYFAEQAPVVEEVRAELVDLVRQGRDVVLDWGLWRREERQDWRRIAEAAGGQVRLLHFPVPKAELLRRLNMRNDEGHANALGVTPEALDDFLARFDEPDDEDVEVILPDSRDEGPYTAPWPRS
ncbi:AAA family ATPase [Cryptosporangium aurantiacum]|uniref:Predicted kinase n=1 Tax=Cryptosporangium aurantiacum TaxID=134849 RepID=A0A1M7RPC9_9ACTN|nr:ATP-binding protein [Cryptosporangium aurantiacum]SHN48217.1 Predicted kinase [Cryptosporangium aurantiacum]